VIAKAPFGTTGHESTRAIFGAAALGKVSRAEAERALELLLEHGVNHIDTGSSYGDSELHLAPWLKRNPGTFFVATKVDERGYGGAREEFRRSLDRLGVDRVDLLQLHSLADPIEWENALCDGGAIDAAVEAREEGLVDFIGITGHGLSIAAMHRRALERFPFDSVLMPYSYRQMQDERYAAEFEALAAVCTERGVAMQTIKSIALAPWDGRPKTSSTWYEPMTDPADIELAVHWVLGREGVFLNTVGDIDLLPHVLAAAESFSGERSSDEQMDELVQQRALAALFV
jgi:aryl-alcohol dehydrogenase-like predicted oxidoreductase